MKKISNKVLMAILSWFALFGVTSAQQVKYGPVPMYGTMITTEDILLMVASWLMYLLIPIAIIVGVILYIIHINKKKKAEQKQNVQKDNKTNTA